MNGFLLDTGIVSLLSFSRAGLARLPRLARPCRSWRLGVPVGRDRARDREGRRAAGGRGGDGPAATLSGRLEATAILAGHAPGIADALIAGIAQSRGLVVVTPNARHFRSFGIRAVTPEEAQGLPLP